ncbi:hypothetical protein [Nocardia testacea]|uniref:hypothetical protein n=1 Tax=Nocardia testacea TaxID=248551 RepID=UPI003A8AA2DB
MEFSREPPWTPGQLKRLGKAIREGREHEFAEVSYGDFVMWYGEFASAIEERIEQMDFSRVLGGESPLVSSRPKTIQTLRDKLKARSSLQLPSIVDVAGVRVEATMDLDDQDEVARLISDELGQDFDDIVSDTRQAPHSGYRALHLRARLPAGRVEIQIRTMFQGAWANMFEALADNLGREIRYGSLPSSSSARAQVESALRTADSLRTVEERKRDLRGTRLVLDDAFEELEGALLNVLELLPASESVSRNEYRMRLEKCRIDREAELRKRAVEDSAYNDNDDEFVRKLKQMEKDLRAERRRGV